jgi:hypothetical protein
VEGLRGAVLAAPDVGADPPPKVRGELFGHTVVRAGPAESARPVLRDRLAGVHEGEEELHHAGAGRQPDGILGVLDLAAGYYVLLENMWLYVVLCDLDTLDTRVLDLVGRQGAGAAGRRGHRGRRGRRGL